MKKNLLFLKTILCGLLFSGLLLSHSAQAQSIWTGTNSTDWFDLNNWAPPGVPGETTDVIIPVASINEAILVTVPGIPEIATINNLLIEGVFTIDPLGYLTVKGTLTNNGVMLMLTDDTFNASLICSSFAGTGIYSYNRSLGVNMSLPEAERGWHLISSPTEGFSSFSLPDYYLNTWDEPASSWVHHVGGENCVPAPEITNDGIDGWSVKIDEAYFEYGCPEPGTGMTVEFMGVPNSGNQNGTVSFTAGGSFEGFNLVGNPYPSYWDYDDFFFSANFTDANINDAIYFWDENTNQYASYVLGIGANGGSNHVPPCQAFFLESYAPGGTLLFQDSDREHFYNAPFWKDEVTDIVRLLASANGFSDETVIRFDANSTINRDKSDARKIKSGGITVPTLYTRAGEIDISINWMPETDIVPVYFECYTAGTYTIEATETSDFTHLVLEDLLTGQMINLLEGVHTFNYTNVNEVRNFKLHFKAVGIWDIEASNTNIWSGAHNIYVDVPETANGQIFVYDLMGREIVSSPINPGVVNTIPMGKANAYYVVKVVTGNNAKTSKVYIQK
jgi:hypothetical protein